MSSSYQKSHLYFFQAMMERGTVTEKQCKEMIEACCSMATTVYGNAPRASISEFLLVINAEIHPYHLKIRKGRREDNGAPVYCLVSLVENELNRLVSAGDFTRQELDYLKKLIDLIVQADSTYTGQVSSITALNLADEIKPSMSKGETKKYLNRLVVDGWLLESNGFYQLTPRSLLELEQYLTREHEDLIPNCLLCNAPVVYGWKCRNCSKRVHLYCAAQFTRTQKQEPKCFSCKKPWPQDFVQHLQTITTVSDTSESAQQDVPLSRTPTPTNGGRPSRKRHMPR